MFIEVSVVPLPTTIAAVVVLFCGGVFAQNSPPVVIDNANWTATDALGRTLPTWRETGDPRPNRWVGVFYWHWHRNLRAWTSYDITEFLKTHPGFKDWVINPPGGPGHPEWYWGQPLFGYYKSTDPWVIRKHLVMLADAGVDFLFFDYTNGVWYDPEMAAFLEVARDLKAKGLAVPRLVFFVNVHPEKVVEHLYVTWYKPGKNDDLWFRWQGKPLIMSPRPADAAKFKDPALLPEVLNYFTWRPTWALFDAKTDPAKWRFIDGHPQRPARTPDGKVEQLVVCKSMGGPLFRNMEHNGVSCVPGFVPKYDDQWLSKENPRGLFFEEQWRVAREVGAPILLVTGWNEWTAAVWETPGVVFLGRKTQKGQGHIVDEFNMDFNRDIEPMKGGYGDNYYWQFVANMRRYKGMKSPATPSAAAAIAIDGQFDDWKGVTPVYRDAAGDTANRDFDGSPKGVRYTNRSARNDIVSAQVARNETRLFFHVQTAEPLSSSTDRNWMLLLIDADANPATGWNGFDYLVNRSRDGNLCTVERNVEGKWKWEKVAYTPIRWDAKNIELAVARDLPGLSAAKGALKFNFQWVDNIPDEPDIMDFYSHGDAAPDGRFRYHFEETPK